MQSGARSSDESSKPFAFALREEGLRNFKSWGRKNGRSSVAAGERIQVQEEDEVLLRCVLVNRGPRGIKCIATARDPVAVAVAYLVLFLIYMKVHLTRGAS